MVVIWSSKQDAGDGAAGDGAEGDNAGVDTDGGDAAPKQNENPNSMLRPEIETPQLVGLLVGLVFLLIFIPGFMCLSNIQPPQTFEAFDSNDAKKKMQ